MLVNTVVVLQLPSNHHVNNFSFLENKICQKSETSSTKSLDVVQTNQPQLKAKDTFSKCNYLNSLNFLEGVITKSIGLLSLNYFLFDDSDEILTDHMAIHSLVYFC